MISYELAAKAEKEHGYRIRMKIWPPDSYIFRNEGEWIDDSDNKDNYYFNDINAWEPFVEKPKMITWWRVDKFYVNGTGLHKNARQRFYKDKDEARKDIRDLYLVNIKVTKWETDEQPDNYEDVE